MTTTRTLDPNRSLADLVADDPDRAAVLDRFGLDFCCHGQRTLADACAAAGLDLAEISLVLARPGHGISGVASAPAPTSSGPSELADHIQATHHAYLHGELPGLVALACKVRGVHGARHPELTAVSDLVVDISADLVPHLAREETVVFPAIRRQAAGSPADLNLADAIGALRAEHEMVGRLLARLRDATHGYLVPKDGCASYHDLYRRLAHLEADTHLHIHLENNVLFPAASRVNVTFGGPLTIGEG